MSEILKRNLLISILLTIFTISLKGQTFQWQQTITAEGCGDTNFVAIGFHPDATDGYDEGIDFYYPPGAPYQPCEMYLWDDMAYLLQILESTTETREFHLYLHEPDTGLVISWDKNAFDYLCTSAILQDVLNGELVDVDMTQQDSIILEYDFITALDLIITPSGNTETESGEYFQWKEFFVVRGLNENGYINTTEVGFGFHPDATMGNDPEFDQTTLPDTYFIDLSIGNGLYTTNIVGSTLEETTWGVSIYWGGFTPLIEWFAISWDPLALDSLCTNAQLTDPFGGIFFDIDLINPNPDQINFGGFELNLSNPEHPIFMMTNPAITYGNLVITPSGISGEMKEHGYWIDFEADELAGHSPLTVHFTPYTEWFRFTINSWLWDFGDGNFSFEEAPAHIYEFPGIYNVSLSVENDFNNYIATEAKEDYITVFESSGFVWHVSTTGSDSIGDGSLDFPFATIQHGLNSSFEKDTVLVASGIYFENIIWPETNGIKLIGSGVDGCIIDGNSMEGVIKFEEELNGIIDTTTLISDFTIQNGYAHEWPHNKGGGIYCFASSPTIKNVTLRNNSTYYGGGGLYCKYSSPIINEVTIHNNNSDCFGSGIYLDSSEVILENVNITSNISGLDGAGIYSLENAKIVLKEVSIAYNNSNAYGGGIASFSGTELVIEKSTIALNSAGYDGHDFFTQSSNLIILNSIIWNNFDETIFTEIESTNIFYSNIIGGWDGEGNIDDNPQFTDPVSGDFTLLPTSPCIDAGTPFFVWEGDTLVNMSEDEYNGNAPDMGAFESNYTSGQMSIVVEHQEGWNLVGLPLDIEHDHYSEIFPGADENTLFAFDVVYVQVDNMEPGEGYWLRFPDETETTLTGIILSYGFLGLNEGWNIISIFSDTVYVEDIIDNDGIIVPGSWYGFAEGFYNTNVLIPGHAYWVRAIADGWVILPSQNDLNRTKNRLAVKGPEHLSAVADANKLTFGHQTLYFSNEIEVENVLSYSLPPKPPLGAKDIRFSGDTKLCNSDECVIEVMNNGSPLTFECEIKEGESWEIVPVIANQVKLDEAIYLNEQTQINFPSNVDRLILRKSTSPQTPTKFTLFPAHPNPFNPVTTIQFSIPNVETGYGVSVQIFNITGRLVETLVDEKLTPGNHTVQWNATEFSSGVYFVNFQSSGFSKTQKILLMK